MKNLVLLVFLLLSFAAFSQYNEIIFSYQPFHKDIGNGGTLSYYKNISTNNAIGLRTNFHEFKESTLFYDVVRYNASIDLVHRYNFLKSQKIRFLGELGISTKRAVQNATSSPALGRPDTSGFPSYLNKGWVKTNYLGFTSALGVDVSLFKIFNLGLGYDIKMYFINDNDDNTDERTRLISNLNVNLGVKF
ncbi:MAG: hypothetical protein ACI8P3_003267 [Saprospiraceae bacterium]|jgi:hypothetical protein